MAEVDVKGAKPGWKSKVKGCCTFVYNPETHEFLGRGAKSWAQILTYYVIFYACLAGFFAINLSLFFTTIDRQQPRLQGFATLLKGHPGMGFRPALDGATLVQFKPADAKSYSDEVTNINEFLKPYNNQSSSCKDCTAGAPGPNDVCCVDMTQYGDCTAANNYGYPDGKPCILLKLNKIYGWIPDPNIVADNGTCNSDYQRVTGECMPPNNSHIAITCEGEVAADVDNIGPFTLYPSDGLSYNFYPYLNTDGYLAPFVFVQFEKPTSGALIMVWCKAWAGNIYHDRTDQAGSVHFELEVDAGKS